MKKSLGLDPKGRHGGKQRAVPLIDYYAYRPISDNGQLFYDATHLNAEGADRFSRLAARRLVSLTDSLNIAGGR